MSPLRILVVEDDPLVARDLESTLTRLGFHVTAVCRSGANAVESAARDKPDVVLMDINLEYEMDGVEAAVRIRSQGEIPIIFLTAVADEETTARARAAQPYGFLLKPFHESELRSVVELAHTRHAANVRIRSSEERFVSTLRSMAEGVISTDVLGTVSFMNPVAEKLTGWTSAEAVGRPLQEVFRVSLPSGEALESQGLFSAGAGAPRAIMLTDREGRSVPIEDSTTPIRDMQGALTGIVILFRRKETPGATTLPAQLPDVMARAPWPNLAGIVGSISDPLMAIDGDWRITYLNALAAGALEGRRENLLGSVLWDCLPPSIHRNHYHDFSTALNRRAPTSFEMNLEPRGLWFEVQLYPFGEGLLALFREITERKRAEEQQNKIEKLESLGLLARGFAHDFNNLLTVLLGHLSLAETALAEESEARGEMKTARGAALQAQGLVQQLLTFARGGAPIKQFADLARMIGEWFAEWPKSPGSSARFLAADGDWRVEADPHQVRRLMSNLMKNAEQALPENGEILITLQRADAPELTPGELPLPPGADPRSWLVITVLDNGEGIAGDILPHVFEPYFTTRADSNASGLGLTVCESIAKAHDGAIRLQPAPGGGIRVRVLLPAACAPGSADPAARRGLPKTAAAPGRRVLILEDEPLIRQLMVRHLEAANCEVAWTADGADTVSVYERALVDGPPIDLIIMDLSIPGGMGGAQAMERIRALDPRVRAIVSSGYSDDPVMARYLDYGFRAVLPKPYQPAELRTLVEELLRGE